ncbi:MAG: SusD/RagB family nutrient-binding outer membrane lipoprotein [Bacteroidota bacterium]
MKKILIAAMGISAVTAFSSCKKYLDINKSPNNIVETAAPMDLLLTNVTINTGFMGGSDLFRYAALTTQQFSGQTTGGETQTQMYEKYLIQSSDVNNAWGTYYATTLNDIEVIIKLAKANNAPYYGGVAKILKAYNYQLLVDAWGSVPFTEAEQTSANLYPKFDDGAAVYTAMLALLDEALNDLNGTSTGIAPGANSTIYSGSFTTKKANWIKFANTLKLRMLMHYSKSDKAGLVTKVTALVNSGAAFMASVADNFEMPFINQSGRFNPIHQFEVSRTNYLFPNKFMVDMMNTKQDPRRPFYFTDFPAGSGLYVGAKAADVSSQKYSRMHVYLRGAASGGTPKADGSYDPLPPTGITYTGDAPIRMLTFAEYNFMRAEAALYGAPGDPQAFFTAGITASLTNAGVAATAITTYLALNGTLTGTADQQLKQIIEEKYVANYGVVMEPWTDWRRTGYPAITKVSNAVTADILRSLPFPQSEIDVNPNTPAQKADLSAKYIFWDK